MCVKFKYVRWWITSLGPQTLVEPAKNLKVNEMLQKTLEGYMLFFHFEVILSVIEIIYPERTAWSMILNDRQ